MSDEMTRRIKRALRRAEVKGERREATAGLTPSILFGRLAQIENETFPESDVSAVSASPEEVESYLAAQNHVSHGTPLGAFLEKN